MLLHPCSGGSITQSCSSGLPLWTQPRLRMCWQTQRYCENCQKPALILYRHN